MLAWRRRIGPDGRGTAKTEEDPLDHVPVALGGNKVYPVTPEMRTWAQERVRKLKASGALPVREDEKCGMGCRGQSFFTDSLLALDRVRR